jgi:hypothetical protein
MMKKPLILLSILLGIGALGMFVLAGTLNFGMGWTIGWALFSVTAVIALVIAFLEFLDGKEGDNIGSYRRPRT